MSEKNFLENNDMIGAHKNQSMQKIMSSLKGEFENLRNLIDQRIKIKKEYGDKIREQCKQIFGTEENDMDDSANKNEVDNINILKCGLLEAQEPEEYKEDLDRIKRNVIIRYLKERLVIEKFLKCAKKAEKVVGDDYENYFLENCGYLQEIKFDFGEIDDFDNEKMKSIEVDNEKVAEIAEFFRECHSLCQQQIQGKPGTKQQKIQKHFQKEALNFLHQMFFKEICGMDLIDVAVKTDIARENGLKKFFELKNPNNNDEDNNIILNDSDDDQTTNLSYAEEIESYKDCVYEMPNDSDVVNELYTLERDKFLKEKAKEKAKNEEQAKEYKKYGPIRKLEKEELAKLTKLEKDIDMKQFNAMLCSLISNPEFIQTILSNNNMNSLLSNAQHMSQDDMDVFMEILNYIDLPLKGDGNSKGILDIAGWFNPQMYSNLMFLHKQFLNHHPRLDFQMYCAQHLNKIIDYGIGFNERSKSREKIALILLVAAIVLYLLVKFGLITSISLPFAIGISAAIGVIGLGLMAYNYFKLKIIEKAMKLFGCPEWYRIEFVIDPAKQSEVLNMKLPKMKGASEKDPMYKLVDSIFSLRRTMYLAEDTTIKKSNLNQKAGLVKMLSTSNRNFKNDFRDIDRRCEVVN